jgi:hypothetical protein
LREGKTFNQAKAYAQDVINRTQNAGRIKDLPLAYTSGGKGWRFFLIFTNQVNQIWNMMRKDLPYAIKAHNLKYVVLKTTAMGLSFLAMGAIGNRFEPPEDEKEYFGWILEGIGEAIPLVGKDIVNAARGFDTGVTPFVPVEAAGKAIQQATSGNVEKAVGAAAEALAGATGLPVTGIKRVIRAIRNRDIGQILGGQQKGKKR